MWSRPLDRGVFRRLGVVLLVFLGNIGLTGCASLPSAQPQTIAAPGVEQLAGNEDEEIHVSSQLVQQEEVSLKEERVEESTVVVAETSDPTLAHSDGDILPSENSGQTTEVSFVEQQLLQILAQLGAEAPTADTRPGLLAAVEDVILDFTGPQRATFANAYGRMPKYWPLITEEFSRRGIPSELAYMALVESGFQPRARSHSGARGLWQFMPGTGRLYGLDHLDDFHDSRLSTQAAGEYLLDLISIFGSRSFLLALASYNGGEGRVQRCLRQLKDPFADRTFWHIRECLPRETRNYVPRILAAAVIGNNPERFGFALPKPGADLGEVEVVVVPEISRQSWVAEQLGISLAELREVNPDLSRSQPKTPGRNFPVFVPRGHADAFRRSLVARRSASIERIDSKLAVIAQLRAETYRVEAGDTLSLIARRHGVGYLQLAVWNGLEAPYQLSVGQSLIVQEKSHSVPYTVRAGNTLQAIAQLFGVEVRDIMGWNELDGNQVRSGQKLVIHAPGPVRVERYKVRRGDTVGAIARQFGVPVRAVLTANGLETRSVIRPGQNLLVFDV